jgi:hypothetical protein
MTSMRSSRDNSLHNLSGCELVVQLAVTVAVEVDEVTAVLISVLLRTRDRNRFDRKVCRFSGC